MTWPAVALWMLAAAYFLVNNSKNKSEHAILTHQEKRVDVNKHAFFAAHLQVHRQAHLLHAAGGAKRRQRGRSRRDAVSLDKRAARSAGRRSSWQARSGTTDTADKAAVAAGSFGRNASNDPVVEMGSTRLYHPSPIGHRPGSCSVGSSGSSHAAQHGIWPPPALDLCVQAGSGGGARTDGSKCASESGFSLFASNILT
ncbi:hypothetical protein FB639_001413 [Coemansia asiatica]|nr:hypothetical protein FB639_001413 [Coemansia asiatica]